MAGLRDIFLRAWGGRSPEEVVVEFKEKLHQSLNSFKEDTSSQQRLRQILMSIKLPLRYLNQWIAQPHLVDSTKLKELAQKYDLRKSDLKQLFRMALELEETLDKYFGDNIEVDQLIVVLRKVVNTLDEHVISELFDAFDRNIDYDKMERAYLDYQEKVQKYYNAYGLNRDLQNILEQVTSGIKGTFSNSSKPKQKPSDSQPEIKMLEPELQRVYDHYREEGYTHEEAMMSVQERQDLIGLSTDILEAYRVLRKEGHNHLEAMEYVHSLSDKLKGEQKQG